MASQWCRFCQEAMDPRDGHGECPYCLGVAHLVEDIENPCHAASELPLEERRRRAQLVEEATLSGGACLCFGLLVLIFNSASLEVSAYLSCQHFLNDFCLVSF